MPTKFLSCVYGKIQGLEGPEFFLRNWLLERINKRIYSWSNHWLSLSGRLVLVKGMLEVILVY